MMDPSREAIASDATPLPAPPLEREALVIAAAVPAPSAAGGSDGQPAASSGGAITTAADEPMQDLVDDRGEVAVASTGGEMGTVKWFSAEKAYGFIAGDDGDDVFVHQSALDASGLRSLRPGQRVRYEEKQGPKGRSAANVTAV